MSSTPNAELAAPSAASATSRRPESPQPGTSTDRETYPARGATGDTSLPAKRQRVADPQSADTDWKTQTVIRQMENEIPIPEIANSLGLPVADVQRIVDHYVPGEFRKIEGEAATPSHQSTGEATVQPVLTEVVQQVIRDLDGGAAPAEEARNHQLTESQVLEMLGQHETQLADIDLSLLPHSPRT